MKKPSYNLPSPTDASNAVSREIDEMVMQYSQLKGHEDFLQKWDFFWKCHTVIANMALEKKLFIFAGDCDFPYLRTLIDQDGPEYSAVIIFGTDAEHLYEIAVCVRGTPILRKFDPEDQQSWKTIQRMKNQIGLHFEQSIRLSVASEQKFGLNAAHLRVLALFLMLLDHMWATVVPGNLWMHCVGRLAFPIFAFQAAEGYHHTRDFKGYCKRLALFALISEIPFNLMIMSFPVFPPHQNVMLTLLLGLLACRAWDEQKWWKLALIALAGVVTFPDYGVLGVGTVLSFHVLRGQGLLQLAMLVVINWFGYEGQQLVLGTFKLPIQAFAILSIIPIWLYNGKKGGGGKWLQYGSYLFYPLHMLVLWLL